MFPIDSLRVNLLDISLLDQPAIANVFRPGDCSRLHADRYRANLLKANDLRASPLYMSRKPIESRGRESIATNPITDTLPMTKGSPTTESTSMSVLGNRNCHTLASMHDQTAMVSLFQPIAIDHELHATHGDAESRKTMSRPPLEAVPEMSELSIDHRRSSYVPSISSPVSVGKQSHSTQPSPQLITFDSSSLQRRQ